MEDTPRAVQITAPGENANSVQPGDFFLIHRTKFFSRLIQFGQGLRYTPEEAYWNHCGVFTNADGSIIEALVRGGVTRGHISKYKNEEYIVVNINATDNDRLQMIKFCNWADGRQYSFLTDISLAFWCIFGGKFDFSVDGHTICSGLVARTLERAGYIFDRNPAREAPADLARHFQVHRKLRQT
jgi:hypothetical protein